MLCHVERNFLVVVARSKILSLQLLLSVVQNAGPVFRQPNTTFYTRLKQLYDTQTDTVTELFL